MATKRNIHSRGALAAIVLALTTTATFTPGIGLGAGTASTPVRVVQTTLSRQTRSWTYGWPLKPFDGQHPVRAFLNDPRIGDRGSRAFHFGIDIAAPDGTAVYAVESGTVYFDSPRAIAVVAPDRSHSFGYWHIVPIVKSHQLVRRHQLLGHIDKGWGHVHFAERRGGVYVNPLRNGGLGPYADHTPPTVDRIGIVGADLVIEAHDTPDPRVPGAWAGEPVTPALLRWRISGPAGIGAWRTAIDFRSAMLPATAFGRVYTAATRQNHKGEPGCFAFYLEPGWAARALAKGAYTIQVEASDSAGNKIVAAAGVSIQDRE